MINEINVPASLQSCTAVMSDHHTKIQGLSYQFFIKNCQLGRLTEGAEVITKLNRNVPRSSGSGSESTPPREYN
jgi:hypothetical protein